MNQQNDKKDDGTLKKRLKLNLYRLPPKNFSGKDDVIYFKDL